MDLIMNSRDDTDWPEPVVRVQSLSNGLPEIPHRYVKQPADRPGFREGGGEEGREHTSIPIIDLGGLLSEDQEGGDRGTVARGKISEACREWGFFQIVNHGVRHELMDRMLAEWRGFFHLPMGFKQGYANKPDTYEGYGSRLGVEEDAPLDWSDYFFLHYLPSSLKDRNKWPALPHGCREVIEEYAGELAKLSRCILKLLSLNLGLEAGRLEGEFGEDVGACLRVNFYPKCPQPELTLGLSSHSDPGGMTLLLPDSHVAGLQVRKSDHTWITVKPVPHAFIVNIGDQIQIMSNAIYKSVEHRVVVNSLKERLSIAFFYNPESDIPIQPLQELVTLERPAFYKPMTFNEYRLFIRLRGPKGKSQVESLKSLG